MNIWSSYLIHDHLFGVQGTYPIPKSDCRENLRDEQYSGRWKKHVEYSGSNDFLDVQQVATSVVHKLCLSTKFNFYSYFLALF